MSWRRSEKNGEQQNGNRKKSDQARGDNDSFPMREHAKSIQKNSVKRYCESFLCWPKMTKNEGLVSTNSGLRQIVDPLHAQCLIRSGHYEGRRHQSPASAKPYHTGFGV